MCDNMDTLNHTSNSTSYYDDIAHDNNDVINHDLPPKLIALILGFFAISLNVMSLLALSQIKNRITTHHRLIISLALSDIVIGVSIVSHFISTSIYNNYVPGYGPRTERLMSWCSSMMSKALNSTGLNISLMNLMAMAFDHYMAIIRPLHYPSQMTKRTAYILITVMWVTAIILGFSDFFTGVNIYKQNHTNYNYCEATYKSKYQDEYTVFSMAILATIVLLLIYSRIYIKIKLHQRPGETNPAKTKTSVRNDMKRNVRASVTTLLILGTFMICWLPTCIYQIALVIQIKLDKTKLYAWSSTLILIDKYFLDLLLVNSIADPVIYAIRMYDVQMGYRRLLSKCIRNARLTQPNHTTYTMTDRRGKAPAVTSCRHDQVELDCVDNVESVRLSSCDKESNSKDYQVV